MRTADTSVVIAAFAPWHEHHEPARRALIDVEAAVAHVLVETYSVLTRLPDPHRVPAQVAAEFLGLVFPSPPLVLDAGATASLPERLVEAGVSGGATYDGVVACTALAADAALWSLDVRATSTYERVGVEYDLLI